MNRETLGNAANTYATATHAPGAHAPGAPAPGAQPLLRVENVDVTYGEGPIVQGASFEVFPGEIWCIAGESGCGKSTLLKALMGIDTTVRATGSIAFEGRELIGMPAKRRKELCGTGIGMIFQDPGSYFNPIRTIEKQLKEMLVSHDLYRRESFHETVLSVFDSIGLKGGERILKSCPYEMSGGMNQRISIAAAFLLRPRLLLADEPTSALDATVQYQVADELVRLRDESGASQVVVTHNLGLAKFLADKIAVMYAGHIVELAPASVLLENPAHPYTRALIGAVPSLGDTLPTPIDRNEVEALMDELSRAYEGVPTTAGCMYELEPGHLICVGGVHE